MNKFRITFEVTMSDTALVDYAHYEAETDKLESIPSDMAEYIVNHLVNPSNLKGDYLDEFTCVKTTEISGIKTWVRRAIQSLTAR